jgi:hypothetical protein
MNIDKNWHPIFKFTFDLFQGGEGIKHFLYKEKKRYKVIIIVDSHIESEKILVEVISQRKKSNIKIKCNQIIEIVESFILNFFDGSIEVYYRIEFESLLSKRTKIAEKELGRVYPQEYNSSSNVLFEELNKIISMIKKSKRIDPSSGRTLSKKEAQILDERIEEWIFEIKNRSLKVREELSGEEFW